MENLKNFYEKYRVYLTRPRLEILAVVTIVFCAVLVFFLNIPGKGVLKLDNGTIVYGQGNFLFDNLDNELWKTSLLIDLKIEENATYQIEYIPILKKKNGVIMAEGEKKEEILQDFFSRSRNAKNEEFISHEFEKFASDRLDNYLSILQGKRFKKFSFKVCNHLFHKKLRKWILNRIYREEEFLQIINYFECEPHRELIIQGAKNRVRDRKKKQEQKTF